MARGFIFFLTTTLLFAATPLETRGQARTDGSRTETDSEPGNVQPTTRVRGIIDHEMTWTGHVMITDDVTIIGTTVRAAAGTKIEFANADRSPVLSVGTERGETGRLLFEATGERPIEIISREGTRPGRIVYFLNDGGEAPAAECAQPKVDIRHIHFVRLGNRRDRGTNEAGSTGNLNRMKREKGSGDITENSGRAGKAVQPQPAPDRVAGYAIQIRDGGAGADVRIENCRFAFCGTIDIECGAGARVSFSENNERNAADAETLRLGGAAGSQTIMVRGNRLTGAIVAAAHPFEISENTLVGPHAAVVAEAAAVGSCRITGNYIHNTSPRADGGYCLDARSDAVAIHENVLVGGTFPVYRGSTEMGGNFILSPEQFGVGGGAAAYTVRSLPNGAEFSRNILVGFGGTLLSPLPDAKYSGTGDSRETVIRENVFLGDDRIAAAISLRGPSTQRVRLLVEKNVIQGVAKYFRLVDEAHVTLVDRDNDGRGRVVADAIARLFSNDPNGTVQRWDSELQSKKKTPRELLGEIRGLVFVDP